MIIFNKADDADLPEGGFSEKQVKEILEYGAIEKMYASGIFFVSSIMGLGGKNDGEFVDRGMLKEDHCKYEEQHR